jgi:hypothetical protein
MDMYGMVVTECKRQESNEREKKKENRLDMADGDLKSGDTMVKRRAKENKGTTKDVIRTIGGREHGLGRT